MSDFADDAQALEEAERQASIDRARICEAVDLVIVETINCTTCGDEIEEERRKALKGVRRCVECQADRERLLGLQRKRAA